MIEKLIQKGKLGSTILISTNIFLELILKQPCISCYNMDFSNCKSKINVNGLGIRITSTCLLCSNITEYCNERSGDDFSKCLTGTALVGGVNREELRSMLALLGITRQNGPQQYFNKQEEFFQGLYQAADMSAENALEAVCEKLQNNNQDILEVSFDCSWSHVRENLFIMEN
jgi:hypothetical protein